MLTYEIMHPDEYNDDSFARRIAHGIFHGTSQYQDCEDNLFVYIGEDIEEEILAAFNTAIETA